MRSNGAYRVIWRALVVAVVAAQVLFVLYLVGDAVPELWESRWIQDDAYISFRYARNLVEGNGLVFNAGERVEGYTNFLWTVMSAVPLAAGYEDPLPAMHRAALALWFATFGLLLVFGLYLVSRRVYTAPLVAAPLVAHWSFNQWYLSGMETPLVAFLTLLVLAIFAFQEPGRRLAAAAFGAASVLLVMARPDAAAFVLGLAVAMVACHPRWLADRVFWRGWVPSFLLPVAAVYLPYTLWRLWYYGGLLPNTYYAKAAYNPMYQRGWQYLQTYFEVYDFAPLLLVPAAAALLTRDRVLRRFLAGCVFGGAAVFLYVLRLGGDFMEWRFLVPVTGVLFAGIGVGLYVLGDGLVRLIIGRIFRRKGDERAWIAAPAAAVGIACAVVGLGHLKHAAEAGRPLAEDKVVVGQETIPSLAKYALPKFNWRDIGRTCGKLLPANTRIATTSAGMIPFFSKLPTLDLMGLNDLEIAREPIEPGSSHRVGHEHELDDRNVMRERGVEVYLRWPELWDYPRALAMAEEPGGANASLRLPDGRYFDVVFLNPDGGLVRGLRGLDDVVFKDPSRVLPKEEMVVCASLLDSERLVDRIDVELPESEAAHGFEEIFDPEAPYGHNYHDKVLAYLESGELRVLRDEGRRIYHQATWVVGGVSADQDLAMIVRHDHTMGSSYRVDVNGWRNPRDLEFPCLPEQWGEVRLIIPRELLLEGENRFLLTRDRSVFGDTEFFHMWFLQRTGGGGHKVTTVP